MAPKTLLLTVTAALALTVPAATAAEDWSGRGQIRTLYNQGNHEDLGCLNSRGQWIVDEPLCGVFEAVRRPESGQFIELYSVEHGRCWVDNVYFRCSAEGEGRNTTFGVGSPFSWFPLSLSLSSSSIFIHFSR